MTVHDRTRLIGLVTFFEKDGGISPIKKLLERISFQEFFLSYFLVPVNVRVYSLGKDITNVGSCSPV